MGYRHGSNVVESPENLVGVEFDEEGAELVFFDNLVEVMTIVVHDNVKILGIPFVGEKVVLHFEHIRVLKHFQNL